MVRDYRDLSRVRGISAEVDEKAIISIEVTFQLVCLSQINESNPTTKILPSFDHLAVTLPHSISRITVAIMPVVMSGLLRSMNKGKGEDKSEVKEESVDPEDCIFLACRSI